MPTIISLILIFVCLLIILAIIIKKLPALAILDVNNMVGAKEAKFKNQIIKQRLERDLSKVSGLFARAWLRINKQVNKFIKSLQTQLRKKKQNYRIEMPTSLFKKEKRIKDLFLAVEDLLKKESLEQAEEKLIEIIGMDEKNLLAFFKLGGLYESLKKWLEARQTYHHALKLARQHQDDKDIIGDLSQQQIHFALALLEKENDSLDASLEHVKEALDLEPNNPRYLDLILDLSIIRKEKGMAIEYFTKLAAVNPENNKLVELKDKIDLL